MAAFAEAQRCPLRSHNTPTSRHNGWGRASARVGKGLEEPAGRPGSLPRELQPSSPRARSSDVVLMSASRLP